MNQGMFNLYGDSAFFSNKIKPKNQFIRLLSSYVNLNYFDMTDSAY